MLTFEEWKERFGFYDLPASVEVYEFMLRQWFESAREGMISAEDAYGRQV